MPRIVAICGDAGGANAVAPVIEFLITEGRVSVKSLAYVQAATLWSQRGMEFDTLNGDVSDHDIKRLLCEPPANLLLTGTSVNSFELEKRFISIARELGLPSLSVLDFWGNYAQRFSDSANKLTHLPDRIAVMDLVAQKEMVAEGIPSSHIVVTGHPALDNLQAYGHAFTAQQRNVIRNELGVTPDSWLIIYASQPPTFSEQDAHIPPPWNDRLRTVNSLLSALTNICSGGMGKDVTLLIRPHPRENVDFYSNLTHGVVSVVVSAKGIPHDLALAADAVLGMTTMFLVEAHFLSRPTLSLRLGLSPPDDFPPNRSRMIPAVYRDCELTAAIKKLLCNPKQISTLSEVPGTATQDTAKLLYSMLRNN